MDFGYRETVLRSRFGQVLAVLVGGICLIGIGGFAERGDAGGLLHALAPLLLVAVGAWCLFWRPSVRIGPAELEFVNPLRTVRIAWPAVEDIETQWSLVVLADGRRWAAWAAPRESALGNRPIRRGIRMPGGETARPVPTDQLPQGALAGAIARRQWEAYRDRGLLGAVEGEAVAVRWHVRTAAVLALLALGALVSLIAP